jgi:Holliday junction resolvase-like predicted endonuclease
VAGQQQEAQLADQQVAGQQQEAQAQSQQLADHEAEWLGVKSPQDSLSPQVAPETNFEPQPDPQEMLDDAAFEKSWDRANTDPVFQPAHPGDDLASFGISRDPSTMTPQERADYAAHAYAPNDIGIHETTGRLARGLAGEKAAAESLASEGHQILHYKPDIAGTNQGGFDMVTMRGDKVYLVDNKTYRREGDLYSASALTTNFDQNLESTKAELEDMANDAARTEEERDTAQRALDLIETGDYQRLVTNASLSNIDNPGLSGVSDKLTKQEVDFLDLMREPKQEAESEFDVSASSPVPHNLHEFPDVNAHHTSHDDLDPSVTPNPTHHPVDDPNPSDGWPEDSSA